MVKFDWHDRLLRVFADGVANDSMTGLSPIKWRFFTARNSSFRYCAHTNENLAAGQRAF